MVEPTITINGSTLSEALAGTVRIAVCNLLMQMSEPASLGDDDHGRAMSQAYREDARTLLQMMKLIKTAS